MKINGFRASVAKSGVADFSEQYKERAENFLSPFFDRVPRAVSADDMNCLMDFYLHFQPADALAFSAAESGCSVGSSQTGDFRQP